MCPRHVGSGGGGGGAYAPQILAEWKVLHRITTCPASKENSRNQRAFSFITLTKGEKGKRILFYLRFPSFIYIKSIQLTIASQISDFGIIKVIMDGSDLDQKRC